jgi:hypothetical protein
MQSGHSLDVAARRYVALNSPALQYRNYEARVRPLNAPCVSPVASALLMTCRDIPSSFPPEAWPTVGSPAAQSIAVRAAFLELEESLAQDRPTFARHGMHGSAVATGSGVSVLCGLVPTVQQWIGLLGWGDLLCRCCSASRAVFPGPGQSLRTFSCPPRRAASAWPGWGRNDAAHGWRDLHWRGRAGEALWRFRISSMVGPVPRGTEGGHVPTPRLPLARSWCTAPGPYLPSQLG